MNIGALMALATDKPGVRQTYQDGAGRERSTIFKYRAMV